MKQTILIILVVLGLSQSLYYSFKDNKVEKNEYNFENKKEINYKNIITNLDRFDNIDVDKISRNEKNYNIDINFKGNLNELKEFIDYMNEEYMVFNCTYKSIEMDNKLISGKIAVNIS